MNYSENPRRGPIIEEGPDGVTIILSRSAYDQLLAEVASGSRPGDADEAAGLLQWHDQFPQWDLARTSSDGCPDCVTPSHGPRRYCDLHRCKGMTSRGERCSRIARQGSGWTFCSAHGCQKVLAVPGVFCPEPSAGFGFCTRH